MSKTLLYAIVNNNFHVVICRVLIKFGSVAQLVEQRPEKPCVGGSIPPRATLHFLTTNPSKEGFYICPKNRWKLVEIAFFPPP